MSIIILGKVIGASIGGSLVALGAWYMADPTTIDNWMAPFFSAEVYGFLKEPAAEVGTSSLGTTIIDGKKLQCKIESGATFECSVKAVTKLADEKKQILLKDFLTISDSERRSTDITSALVAKKLYQIKDTTSDFKSEEWKAKPIKVFYKSNTSENALTELGSITSMFMLRGRTTQFVGKTHSFVGQASSVNDILTSIDGYKCSWTQNAAEGKGCKIYPLVNNDGDTNQKQDAKISDLEFKQTDIVDSSIKTSHYYLIQFNAPSDSKDLESFDVAGSEIIYLKDGSDDKVTFKKLSAVTVVGEELLILKKHKDD